MIEATVFEDSDLRRLFTMLPHVSELLKDVVGHTFWVKRVDSSARAQVFVDRVCEQVWEVKGDKWRYDNMSKVQRKFRQGVKQSDLRLFLLAYEYSVLHELLHDLREEALSREEQAHSAAKILLRANHS